MAARIKTYVATVRPMDGLPHTSFPIDMLRYDNAWPRTGEDSVKIIGTFDNIYPDEPETIEVVTRSPGPAASAFEKKRWESFGWKVVSIKEL